MQPSRLFNPTSPHIRHLKRSLVEACWVAAAVSAAALALTLLV